MEQTALKDRIRGYIVDNFLFGDTDPLKDDAQSLLDTGIIDSVGVMELVAFLEGDLGLKIEGVRAGNVGLGDAIDGGTHCPVVVTGGND